MNFDLDENQTMFAATVAQLTGGFDVVARHRARALPGGLDRTRWAEFADAGLLALGASEADGGLGGSSLDCTVVAQALGKGLSTAPWLECGYLPAQLLAGTAYLGAVLDGSALTTLAFAEADTRYRLDPLRTIARRSGDGFILSGEKRFVLSGAAADQLIVTALLDGATALFMVPADTVGVARRAYAVTDGSLAAVVTLRDVSIGAGALIAGGGDLLDAAVTRTRLLAAAEMVGLAQRLFDDTLTYVKTREQFGKPIGSFQAIQHRMVDDYAMCEQMQSGLWRAVIEGAADDMRRAIGIKAFVGERALHVGHEAVQLHGGMGMTDELAIGHALKRVLLLSKLFGDPASGIAHYAAAA